MSVIVVGLNHRTVPLGVLERTTVPADRLAKALADVLARLDVTEAVILSTCNRTEVYAQTETFHGAVAGIRDFFAENGSLALDEISDHLYTFHDTAAAAHLFTVSAGLDSAVLGETEILGQVRSAWETARQVGAAGPQLNALFRHAAEVGKRVRRETGISRSTTSVPAAAVALAADRLGGLAGRRVLVIGAGEMGEAMALSLSRSGVSDVLVANRSPAGAAALAARVGGSTVALIDVPSKLSDIDVLLTSTGSTSVLVDRGDLEPAVAAREGRPLLIVDVAVPRDVDPSAREIEGVTLLDMDDLRAFADAGLASRRQEVGRARDIVDDEVARFRDVQASRQAAPLVADLRNRVEAVRAAEVARVSARLSPAEREALDVASQAVVAKLLHEPTLRLKDAAGTVRGERLAEALRELFDLE